MGQHLIDLTLELEPGSGHAQRLWPLGRLKALQGLHVTCAASSGVPVFGSMSGEKLALNLPHLTFIKMSYISDGQVILSCPKLTGVCCWETTSLCVVVEDAVLESLTLLHCQGFEFATTSPGNQLQNLANLNVTACSEVARHVIEDIGQMRYLRTLIYRPFPIACMPRRFPKGLVKVVLCPIEWCYHLPSLGALGA